MMMTLDEAIAHAIRQQENNRYLTTGISDVVRGETEWVVAPAAVEIIAKESETAAEPSPLVAAIDVMHRSARRMPNRWPEF